VSKFVNTWDYARNHKAKKQNIPTQRQGNTSPTKQNTLAYDGRPLLENGRSSGNSQRSNFTLECAVQTH
jgi:hypothetical protein